MKTTIKKKNENLLAWIEEERGLIIEGHWAVGIPKTIAIKYVNEYDSLESLNGGFVEYEDSSKVILTHNESKITLTKSETSAIIEMIKAAYM